VKSVAIVSLAATALFAAACGDKSPPPADARESSFATPGVAPTTSHELSGPEASPPVVVGPVTFERAESVYAGGRYEEAVALLTGYTESRPDHAWGHYLLGLSRWKTGDRPGAEVALRRALEIDTTLVKASLNLTRVLLEQQKSGEAREVLDGVLASTPDLPEAHRLVGRLHEVVGDSAQAAESYLRAVALDSGEVWSMNNLGVLLITQGRYEEALRPLARAVALRPGAPVFQNNLGIALERTGRFGAAAEAFRAGLAADSTYGKSQVNLERVAALTESPTVTPVDLSELAREFVADVERWKAERSVGN
jgi:Tfp pilus assembly protein PilF